MVPNRINKLQQRALRLEYKDTPFTIHQRNIQKLAIEMYQVNHKITPKCVNCFKKLSTLIIYGMILHSEHAILNTAQKMKFSIKDFFSKLNQVRSFLRIWSHLLKKSSMENFFCAVKTVQMGLKHCHLWDLRYGLLFLLI